jgi:hypothetical protein
VLIAPVLGVAAVAGGDLASAMLGSKLNGADTQALVGSFLALAGYMFAMLAVTVPLLAAFAQSRYLAVAGVSAAAVVVHVGLSAVGASTDELKWLAVAASVSTILMLVGLLVVVFGRSAGRPLGAAAVELVAPVALAAVTFGAAGALTVVVTGSVFAIVAAAVAVVAYAVLLRALLPAHWELVERLLAPLATIRARSWRTARSA